MSRTILVTGGAGFIGSHVCERLVSLGAEVVALDNLKSGKAEFIAHLEPACRLVIGDVTDRSLLAKILPKVEAVVHLAAEPSVQRSIESPLETHAVNFGGTLALLVAMNDAGVRRLVFASSAAVYPKSAKGPLNESMPCEPASPYGLDKLSGEHLLRIYRDLHGFDATSLRFFNVYGERQDPKSPYSGVISLFTERILAHRPLVVFGSGLQTRDFVYVGDVATVISELLETQNAPPVMNVATGHSSTLLDLIAALEQVTCRKATITHEPQRPGDIFDSRADVSLLRSTALTVPKTALAQGLARAGGA